MDISDNRHVQQKNQTSPLQHEKNNETSFHPIDTFLLSHRTESETSALYKPLGCTLCQLLKFDFLI